MKRSLLFIGVPFLLAGCSSSSSSPQESEMVEIPAGQVTMGDASGVRYDAPVRVADISSFKIDKYEVTNLQYRQCVTAGVCTPPSMNGFDVIPDYYTSAKYNNYPVTYVNWFQAAQYCDWAGKRLPTEAEWEYAARGDDGRTYPWGDEDPTCEYAQFGECNNDDGLLTPREVGSFAKGASPFGVMDMGGNMSEWVQDWYDVDAYRAFQDGDAPVSPAAGISKILRGGSWWCESFRMNASLREPMTPVYRGGNVGFRCAQ